MNKPDGGPAYPRSASNVSPAQDGMSLRDKFADSAIKLFSLDAQCVERMLDGDYPRHSVVAKFRYDLADAMLEARE